MTAYVRGEYPLSMPALFLDGAGDGRLEMALPERMVLFKEGPGTWDLAGANAVTGGVNVLEGRLVVDGSLPCDCVVTNGAAVGGTGTVARATIEAGGGFTAAPDQTEALTLNAVELPVSGEVTLDVQYTGSIEDLNSVRVPVVTANALAGAKWRVTLNGAAVPSGYVGTASVRDGVVYATVARGGTCIIFR
jgi:autotransporter-associated beta strand protein